MVENDIIDVFCYGSTSVFIRAEKLEFHAIIHNVLKLKTKTKLTNLLQESEPYLHRNLLIVQMQMQVQKMKVVRKEEKTNNRYLFKT